MILGQKKVIDGRIHVQFRQDDHAPATSLPRTIDCFMSACTGLLRLRLCKLSAQCTENRYGREATRAFHDPHPAESISPSPDMHVPAYDESLEGFASASAPFTGHSCSCSLSRLSSVLAPPALDPTRHWAAHRHPPSRRSVLGVHAQSTRPVTFCSGAVLVLGAGWSWCAAEDV